MLTGPNIIRYIHRLFLTKRKEARGLEVISHSLANRHEVFFEAEMGTWVKGVIVTVEQARSVETVMRTERRDVGCLR